MVTKPIVYLSEVLACSPTAPGIDFKGHCNLYPLTSEKGVWWPCKTKILTNLIGVSLEGDFGWETKDGINLAAHRDKLLPPHFVYFFQQMSFSFKSEYISMSLYLW